MATELRLGAGLARLFNVRSGEGRLVGTLIALYFALGIAFVLVQAAGFALFLDAFTAQALPFSYLATAVVASLLAAGYLKLAGRLSVPTLLRCNIGFLLSVTLLLRVGLALPSPDWVIFLLPLWFQTLVNLGNLAFWGLTGRLFDVRQGKRLFGPIGAGNWLATIAGGMLTPWLVARLGTANLLVVATVSLGVALALLGVVLHAHGRALVAVGETPHVGERSTVADLFRNRYIVLICLLIVCWWVGFFVIDNIFYDSASARYQSTSELASFLGLLYAAQGMLALVTTSLLTSRIIGRFGLRAGLLTMPVVLTVTIAALALTGTLRGPVLALFALAAFAKLVNVALGFSLEQSSLVILYQPLPPDLRLRVQTVAEGIVQSLSIGLAGALLLVFTTVLGFGAVGLSYLFLPIAAAWMMTVAALVRRYPIALTEALARSRLGEAPLMLTDASSLASLERAATDPHPGAALYVADLLARLEPAALPRVLPTLLEHPSPEVRQDALERIEHMKLVALLPAVERHAATDAAPPVRGAAVRTLAVLGGDAIQARLMALIDDRALEVRRGALAALLRGGPPGVLTARERLATLATSPSASARKEAAQIVGEAGEPAGDQPLRTLLGDPELSVRRSAVRAVGTVRQPDLWPMVVQSLAEPGMQSVALPALAAGGAAALPALGGALRSAEMPLPAQLRIVRLCGRLGQRAIPVLEEHIAADQPALRTAVLAALGSVGYHAPDVDGEHCRERIHAEVAEAAWALAGLVDLGADDRLAALVAALQAQVAGARERIFWLLSFLYDAQAMLNAHDGLTSDSDARRAYAVEIIDTLVDRPLKAEVLPLVEMLPPAQRLARLAAVAPQPALSRDQRLVEIAAGNRIVVSAWTRCCALDAIGRLPAPAAVVTVRLAADDPEPLVRMAAHWSLARLGEAKAAAVRSPVERVQLLKTVVVFQASPDEVLAALAMRLTEEEVAAGTMLFAAGEPGTSLYIVVSGRLRVHDAGHTLEELGSRDVVGEMAVLDPAPRLASVTALETTRLARLDAAAFMMVLEERQEVARGVIQVLTRRLRQRVHDLSDLRTVP